MISVANGVAATQREEVRFRRGNHESICFVDAGVLGGGCRAGVTQPPILQTLWLNTYRPPVSKHFKSVVGKFSQPYSGYEQQVRGCYCYFSEI
jgi:hypothetical protein